MTKPGIVIRFSLLCAAFYIVLFRLFFINDFGFPEYVFNTPLRIYGLSIFLALAICLALMNATLRKYFPSLSVLNHFKLGVLMCFLAEIITQSARALFQREDFNDQFTSEFLFSMLGFLAINLVLACISAFYFGRKS